MAKQETISPLELLRSLVRFDTTNPPGNERACIGYLRDLLVAAGFEAVLVGKDPQRPNLVSRLEGQGKAPGLLLYGHVDVVTTEGQKWTYPPFAAEVAEGFVWGRGTLDMKGAVAMMVAAFLRAKAEGLKPAGDVVFAAVVDEENMGVYGAKYLVEEQARLFAGVRYALGELGGFPVYLEGKRFYVIQVAEKQTCRMKVTICGPGGHASQPVRGGAMAKLARILQRLDTHRLPVHITPVARQFVETVVETLPSPANALYQKLLDPTMTDKALDEIGPEGRIIDAMLHNTVSPTIVRGGHKVNVIPTEIVLDLDGRVLPGYNEKDMLRELGEIIGDDADTEYPTEVELLRFTPGPSEPDMGLYDLLAQIVREFDSTGTPVPFLLPATTDARFFSRLGIQTYGFTPMSLPETINVLSSAHAADECIPVETVDSGAEAIFQVLQRFGSV